MFDIPPDPEREGDPERHRRYYTMRSLLLFLALALPAAAAHAEAKTVQTPYEEQKVIFDYDFVELVPSAITELAHWQLKGYALIKPEVMDKKLSIEEIR